jgi:hypothetical protein
MLTTLLQGRILRTFVTLPRFPSFVKIQPIQESHNMSVPESKSVPRGVIWIIVIIAATILVALANLSASLINQRFDTLDKRGMSNQERIAALESKYAVIETRMNQNTADHAQIMELLKEVRSRLR